MRRRTWALAVAAGVGLVGIALVLTLTRPRGPAPELDAIGPKTVSNETATPLALYGRNLHPGLRLKFGAPVNRTVPVEVVDGEHAYARLPAEPALPAATTQLGIPVSLEGGTGAPRTLTVVNDAAFPELVGLCVSGSGRVLAISRTTDQIFSIDPQSGAVTTLRTADGPTAIAALQTPDGAGVAIGHRFTPEVWILKADLSGPVRRLPAPTNVSALAVSLDGRTLFVAEQARDSVSALDVSSAKQRWRTRVDPNPGALVVAGGALVVGSQGAGTVQVLDPDSGSPRASIQPGADVELVGGRTAPYGRYVIGGKGVRGLAWSPSLKRVFETSIGPNVGPNPDRMEVSMNPGVGVIDPIGGRFERHLGFGDGLDEGLVLDDARGVLYVADTGLGRVRVIDARKLGRGEQVASAELGSFAIPPLDGTPRLPRALARADAVQPARGHRNVVPTARRPAGESETGSAGDELHTGPYGLALSSDGRSLYALDRFSGTLAVVDVRDPAHPSVIRQIRLVDAWTQPTRRLGEILYYGDPAHTGITCDGCHLEGAGEGVFFAKTHPLRVYRAPTLRGVKDTPPYFTPASTHSLAETSRVVGERNRLFRQAMTPAEIDALTTFTGALTTLPDPDRLASGAPPDRLPLPWGGEGSPKKGAAVFRARGCQTCHPPPLYTLDQDGLTRGRYLDVGTPRALPIRAQWQDSANGAFAIPSLVESWDVFPMLTSGAAGLKVEDDAVRVETSDPIRVVLEREPGPHDTSALSPVERNDLYAFLLSL